MTPTRAVFLFLGTAVVVLAANSHTADIFVPGGEPTIQAGITAPAQAGVTVIDTFDQGWYRDNGVHFTELENYLVGNSVPDDPFEYHNFFVFDLTTIDTEIVSLTLSAFNPASGTTTPDPSETWMLWDFTSDIADLIGGTAGVAGWVDLGSGTRYGSREVLSTETDVLIDVDLNAAAVADANAATGLWAIGGSITTLDGDPFSEEFIFGSTGPLLARLTITFAQPGACCLPNFSCQDLTESECAAAGGLFFGEGTECTTTDCPVDCNAFPCGNNDNKVLLCHVPPGNPGNELTLCISPKAVAAHLENHEGDHCGSCDDGGLAFGLTFTRPASVDIETCPTDFNGDGSVGILDLLMLLVAWGTDPGGPPFFDGDRTVGILDLLTLLANWGACP